MAQLPYTFCVILQTLDLKESNVLSRLGAEDDRGEEEAAAAHPGPGGAAGGGGGGQAEAADREGSGGGQDQAVRGTDARQR